MTAGVPGARSPIAQVTVPAATVHGSGAAPPTKTWAAAAVVPAGDGSVTISERATDGPANVTRGVSRSGGSASVTTTPWATDGPALSTLICQATSSPGAAATGPDLAMRTSALVPTSLATESLLLFGNGSDVPDDVVAALVTEPAR